MGEFLYSKGIEGIKNMQRVNKDPIHIEMKSKDFAYNLIDNYVNLIPYGRCNCYILLKYITCRIIVNYVHTDLNMNSIGQYLQEKYSSILGARRIYRKNEDKALIPTKKLDALQEGSVTPDFLFIFFTKCSTTVHISPFLRE